MEQGLKKNNTLLLLNHFLFLFFFAGLIFSFRAISSISTELILLTGLIANRSSLSSLFRDKRVNFFIAGCSLFFLLQVLSLLFSKNGQGWEHIRLKTGLLITPLAICCSGYLNSRTAKRLFFDFCLLLAIASLFCIVVQVFHYLRSGDPSLFFYHQLVSPLKQHAVYFSLFVFIALVFLAESIRKKDLLVKKVFYILLIIYFSIFLFFLSSKLVIVFFIACLLYFFISELRNTNQKKIVSVGLLILVIVSGSLVLITNNPISKRFSEITKGDIALFEQEQYKPADYFNGLQFRMLQWKLVPEILNEHKAWLTGVGIGSAQYYLDQKYISKNMYTGDPLRKDHGYIGYNTHNQFLQSLLQNGIIGLLIFAFICFGLVRMTGFKKEAGSIFITSLLIFYSFAESIFETQYGIIIFTLFPLLVYFSEAKNESR